MTASPLRSVASVLAQLDSGFAAFARSFNAGEYVLWLGSGISRDRVPNVGALLERVLELLRCNIDPADNDCKYRVALDEVLGLAFLTAPELSSLDLSRRVADWPLKNRIISSLVTQYSKVLDVAVGDDNPEDYLVWTGLDVPNTYGDPAIEPDVEHYAVAMLMREGLVGSAVTANWDGLLEKAFGDLTPAFDALAKVVVTAEDFREIKNRIPIVKFHGCAVLAREDEATYRPLLIARESQIARWTSEKHNEVMRKHLENLYTDHPTLMIGLSAQDANLQTVFATAFSALGRAWPEDKPTLVLSEEDLKPYHKNILKLTYGPSHQGNATAIANSALLGSFGKPTLLALILSSLTEKLAFLLERVLESEWSSGDIQNLRADLIGLRDELASYADDERMAFLKRLIDGMDVLLTVFRTGRVPAGAARYTPVSDRPIAQAIHSPDFPSAEFGRLGVALSLIGHGRRSGHWSIVAGDRNAPDEGVLRLVLGQRAVRLYFVKDATTLNALELSDFFDASDGNVLVVVADEEPPRQGRSSRSRFGRTGKVTAGRFSVAENTAESGSVDELFEAFKLAGGF